MAVLGGGSVSYERGTPPCICPPSATSSIRTGILIVHERSTTPEFMRDNRKSQVHEYIGGLTSKVNSHYLSRGQWLQLPNPTAG